MIGTIGPMVNGERKRRKRWVLLGAHAAGYVTAAALTGGIVACLRFALPALPASLHRVGLAFLAFIALLCTAEEAGVVRLPHPQSSWAVPATWRRYLPRNLSALLYGLALGPGVTTRIEVSAFYIVVLWCALLGHPVACIGVFLMYGVGRAVPIALICGRRSGGILQNLSIIDSKTKLIHCANAFLLAIVGGTCAGRALMP